MLKNTLNRIFLLLVIAFSASIGFGAELVTNGGFETGDFTGWTVINPVDPWMPWEVSPSGTGGGYSPVPDVTSVQHGTYNAWNGVTSDIGSFLLYQDITIPVGSAVRMTWTDRYQMNHTSFCTDCGTATYAVEVLDTSDNLLQTLYTITTLTGVNSNTGVVNHVADLTSYQGQTIRIRFRATVDYSYSGPGQVEIDAVSVQTLAPTAAPVTVEGRVLSDSGRPVYKALVTITDQYGVKRSAMTNMFGNYRFEGVSAGETYVIAVSHKQYRFPGSPALINVNDRIAELDFVAGK